MGRMLLSWVPVAAGAVLVVFSALADPLGIGDGGGFGYKQVIGVVVGGALVAGGLLLRYIRRGDDASGRSTA